MSDFFTLNLLGGNEREFVFIISHLHLFSLFFCCCCCWSLNAIPKFHLYEMGPSLYWNRLLERRRRKKLVRTPRLFSTHFLSISIFVLIYIFFTATRSLCLLLLLFSLPFVCAYPKLSFNCAFGWPFVSLGYWMNTERKTCFWTFCCCIHLHTHTHTHLALYISLSADFLLWHFFDWQFHVCNHVRRYTYDKRAKNWLW